MPRRRGILSSVKSSVGIRFPTHSPAPQRRARTLQLGVTAEDAESGIRSVSVTIGDEVVAPDAAVDLAALGLYGDVVVTVTATNHAGLTSSATSSLLVVPATGATTAPGTGTLSNTSGWEYGLHDGDYDVVMKGTHHRSEVRASEEGIFVPPTHEPHSAVRRSAGGGSGAAARPTPRAAPAAHAPRRGTAARPTPSSPTRPPRPRRPPRSPRSRRRTTAPRRTAHRARASRPT